MQIALLIVGTLVAGTLSAVTGFGGAAILLPLLVTSFGVRESIPILTVAQLIGNGSRVAFNRKDLDWKVVGWFAVGAIPAAVLGSLLFTRTPSSALSRLLGCFLLLVVVYRHVAECSRPIPLKGFAPLGAAASFISALLGSVGPLMAPFFLAYGLVKEAYIGTEALASALMHIVKLATYGSAEILTVDAIKIGASIGLGLIAGSFIGKRIVHRVSERTFTLLVEATLVIAGIGLLVAG